MLHFRIDGTSPALSVLAALAVMVLVELWFVVRQVLRISLGFYEWATAQAS